VSGGTLVLDAPSRTIFGPLNIGLGVGTTTTATVRLAYDDQINDTSLPITINADGKLDADGFYESLGTVNMNGGQFALAGNVRIFGGLTMNGGTITDTGGGELEMRSNVVATSTAPFGAASINATVELVDSPMTFTVNSGSTQPELTINGAVLKSVFDPDRNLIKTGAGTLRLAGTTANNYGGSTTIAQGTLELAKPDNVGAITGPIVIGNGTDPAGSATLKNMASNQLIGKPDVQINLSGVYQVSDTSTPRTETIGKLSGSGKLFLPFRPELTIDFPVGSSEFAGVIDHPAPNASGNKRINKRGGGVQIFNVDTTYDGLLAVYNGVLSVNGQMVQAPVSIQGGTLRGGGRVGDVDVGSNVAATSTLQPSSSLSPLTTGMAAFSFGPSARLQIDLPSATPGNHPRLSVTGAFRPGDNGGGSLYVNPVNNPTPANGTVFEIVSKVSAGVATSTFLGLPEGRSVYMGARNGKISYVGGDGNDVTLTVAPTLDIDGDSRYLPETDGLLITRYIRGLTGPALATQVVATSAGARRTVNADVEAYLAHLGNALDVDQNGVINSTDSTLILRYMFGFRGAALIAGVPLPGGENANTVAARIAALTP
jgi:autotransporter-associated beta strand protein